MDPERLTLLDRARQAISGLVTLLIIFIGYPIGFIIFIPVLFYRYTVQVLVKRTDPKFGGILKGLNAVISAHSPYTNCRSLLLPQYYLAAPIDKSLFIKTFNEKIVQLKDPQGNLIYTELKQRIVSKFGYHFWYDVDNFQLEDHIRFYNESCPEKLVKQAELNELVSQRSQGHFDKNRSPWEIILIPRFEHDKDPTIKSVMLLRFHHCFWDGFSMLKMCERLGEKPWKTVPTGPGEVSGSIRNIGFFKAKIFPTLRLLVEGPYQMLRIFFFSGENNQWLQKITKEPSGNISTQLTDAIPMSTMRTVIGRSKGKFTLPIILNTIFLQVAARAMQKQGILNKKNRLAKIFVGSPWPLPNHPVLGSTGLTNHWSVVKYPVIVDLNDVGNTIQNVEKEYKKLPNSILPHVFAALTVIMGYLPISWIEKSDKGLTGTCLLSNFPLPFHAIDICGVEVIDWITGGSASACALSCLAQPYNGHLRYLFSGDRCILTQEDVNELTLSCQQIVKELQYVFPTEKNKLSNVPKLCKGA